MRARVVMSAVMLSRGPEERRIFREGIDVLTRASRWVLHDPLSLSDSLSRRRSELVRCECSHKGGGG